MQILLAGYNVDAEVLEELIRGQERQDVTPETISAAYARISRDPRPVNELRKIARQEVEKARRSNSKIIFEMGHHSIAEHAVFNFDLMGISRLALEEIEKFRLCSFTEKSQRYQKLENNFVVPEEIRGKSWEKSFVELVRKQNNFYQKLIEQGIEPEDARYVTSLATCGQVGLTINARNLELLIRRFASHSLLEVKEVGRRMYELVARISPSIVLFTSANDFDQKTYPELRKALQGKWERKRKVAKPCVLVDYTDKADLKLVAALIHTAAGISFINSRRLAKSLLLRERKELVKIACRYMEFYDAPLREFEHISLTYDLILSAACFAQMKRHRMATITAQRYDPALGVTIPPSLKRVPGLRGLLKETEELYYEIVKEEPVVAQYVLTGAHRRRILMTVNARELYHISRLREDIHAQWDIRNLVAQMTRIARKVMPETMMLIGGKHEYSEIYRRIYGTSPKVLPPRE